MQLAVPPQYTPTSPHSPHPTLMHACINCSSRVRLTRERSNELSQWLQRTRSSTSLSRPVPGTRDKEIEVMEDYYMFMYFTIQGKTVLQTVKHHQRHDMETAMDTDQPLTNPPPMVYPVLEVHRWDEVGKRIE